MHLFGGNGRHGRHGASGHDSDGYDYEYGEDYGEDEEEEEACYDDGAHYDDDYDYDRRYYERMERYERRSQYARRGEYRPYEDYDPDYGRYGERRFASDDIVSREELRARRPRWPRRLLAAFLTLVVLAGGLFAAYRVWAQRPDQQQGGLNDYSDPEPAETGVGAVEPQSDANKRDGVWTFFIAGIDVVGNHNDTNMVGMFDTVNGKLNIVNLPRDMLVNVNLNIKKINQPYAADINNGGDGIDPLLECISDILGYSVDMYALIDISAAAEIVDAIGGVYFDIPYDMDWDAPDQDPPLHIHIKAGPQTLDGENFVNAMRFRMSNDGSHSYAGGDIQRIAFQQELLTALASQALQIGNILNIGEMYRAVMDNMINQRLRGQRRLAARAVPEARRRGHHLPDHTQPHGRHDRRAQLRHAPHRRLARDAQRIPQPLRRRDKRGEYQHDILYRRGVDDDAGIYCRRRGFLRVFRIEKGSYKDADTERDCRNRRQGFERQAGEGHPGAAHYRRHRPRRLLRNLHRHQLHAR